MYSQLLTAVLGALAVVPAAASPVEARTHKAAPHITDHFYLTGNATGIASVDGVRVGASKSAGNFVGFGIAGEKPTKFGYDNKSARVYAGKDSKGRPLVLGAFAINGTAAIKTALGTEPGFNPLECTVLARTLFCNANIGNTLYHDLLIVQYQSGGPYDLAIGPTSEGNTEVQLVVSKA